MCRVEPLASPGYQPAVLPFGCDGACGDDDDGGGGDDDDGDDVGGGSCDDDVDDSTY